MASSTELGRGRPAHPSTPAGLGGRGSAGGRHGEPFGQRFGPYGRRSYPWRPNFRRRTASLEAEGAEHGEDWEKVHSDQELTRSLMDGSARPEVVGAEQIELEKAAVGFGRDVTAAAILAVSARVNGGGGREDDGGVPCALRLVGGGAEGRRSTSAVAATSSHGREKGEEEGWISRRFCKNVLDVV